MKIHVLSFALLCSILIPFIVQAQDASFVATASATTVAAGEQFEVSFTLTGNDPNAGRKFQAPKFDNFVVMSGPNQSTSMKWINGQVTATITYTYILYARTTGTFTIQPASIEYSGKTLKTNPLTITVTSAQAKKHENKPENTVDVGDNIFIRAIINKNRAYVGEQITLTYKLYFRATISGYDLIKAPTYEGFWSEDFEIPRQPQITTETVNAKQYRVAIIKKTALFPTQAGKLKIAPLEVRCAVQVQTKRRYNDPFDAFFGDPFFQNVQTIPMDFQSNSLTVTVDPLPVNIPSAFSGGIGQYNFHASIDKHTVKAGDAITLKIQVSGTGNIKLVSLPKPLLPADIEAYDPKISESITREGDLIRGRKTAEYLLIPRNAGKRIIEPIKFVYYDLGKGSFITHTSPRFELTIQPGKNVASGLPSTFDKEDIRVLGEDIRFIKLTTSLQKTDEEQSPLMSFLLLFVPPLLYIGAWSYQKRRERLYGDMPRFLFETAGRAAHQRLKKARQLFEQGNVEQYNAEILSTLTDYLIHKLRISRSAFTLERAIEELHNHKVPQNTLLKLQQCVERAQFTRYAPQSDTKQSRRELLDLATEVIQSIETSFRKKTSSSQMRVKSV